MEKGGMKRYGYLFEQVCDFSSLGRACRRAFAGSGSTEEACRFNFHLEKELLSLKKELNEETYLPAPYRYFKVSDPKERIISVASFRDRVVHHAVVAALEPIFERTFIFDSYATRKGKGSHRAVRRAQAFLQQHGWYLKLDVEKYFDSIDHGILMELIARKVKDARLLRLLERIIHNSDVSRGLEEGKGLPIGNLTSQFFANVYLNALDHHVKDKRGEKAYIRYMDDMVVFADSRDQLRETLKDIEEYIAENLKLRIKERATCINTRLHGLPFLGYRIFPKVIRVKRENLKRVKARLAGRIAEYGRGEISEAELAMSARSWFEFVGFADSLALRQSFLGPLAALPEGDMLNVMMEVSQGSQRNP
jgi:retron-type reverse transcriptase